MPVGAAAAGAAAADPAARAWAGSRFLHLQPGGPVCLVAPCLLVSHLPLHVGRSDVLAELGAQEAWLQPPGTASSGGGGQRCVCVFKAPL